MPMAAGLPSPTGHTPPMLGPVNSPMITVMTEVVAKDAILGWFRGEFAAANAIIDDLCGHLAQLSDGGSEYVNVFAAIHRRRLNWIPVLQMQKYHSIADVTVELRKVTEKKVESGKVFHGGLVKKRAEEIKECLDGKEQVDDKVMIGEKVTESNGNKAQEILDQDEDSPDSEITDSGSQGHYPISVGIAICTNHEDCKTRPSQIKLLKGFSAKEQVKGHMVNVVKGLRLYEGIFTDLELSKLTEFVNKVQSAGQNGELSGDTYILFNQQMKGNRREMIQFGVPLFGQITEEAAYTNETKNIEPIPALLWSVIDHLVLWQVIPEYKKPNGCIINFFREGEHSQPFQKPPHLDHPVVTLFLSESTVAFGRTLVIDTDGNYTGPLMLSLKEGSLLVMRGNSADMARHVMCPHPNGRVSITFFRVRPDSNQCWLPTSPSVTGAMTLWQPVVPNPYALQHGGSFGIDTIDQAPTLGVHAPVVMIAPSASLLSSSMLANGGTGVFLPCTVKSRNSGKHLPPRARKGRFLELPSPVETCLSDSV